MPELPEVETVRRGLDQLLPGRRVKAVFHDNMKSFLCAPEDMRRYLVDAEVVRVERRAKMLMLQLSSGYVLVVHLKMTGQLVFRNDTVRFGAGHPNDSLVGPLPDKSTRVVITFVDGSRLFFNDQRKFGWMRLMPASTLADLFKDIGPEPLRSDFTWKTLRSRLLRHPRTSIKAALLDQHVLAGVGNIYADESLWGARIHPQTVVGHLSALQIRRLHTALLRVLRLSIEKGGSTDKNYVDAEGKRGSYLQFARVFRREGLPCPRCGTTLVKTRVAGRGTHLCPYCQPLSSDMITP